MSNNLFIPKSYKPALDILHTEIAIKFVKDTFERELASALNLVRVSAPLFVRANTGVNDNLNGVERPVQFDILDLKEDVQIVQSLAKWKRLALYRYGIPRGSGLYTDMNAIRRDEVLDNLHSVYVDQWDWERVIRPEDRTVVFLQSMVEKIVGALYKTQQLLCERYPVTDGFLNPQVTYLTTQELEDRYPDLTPHQREDEAARKYGTVFIMGIGGKLRSGQAHDGRSPDYDDWELNGDIVVYNPLLERSFEVSSMGIRVDAQALDRQLRESGCDDRRELPFHKMLLDGTLPLTAGGGIGQSRICMLLLQKAHIGEVQASVWPEDTARECEAAGVHLL